MFEVSPWTSLSDTLANLPPEKSVQVVFHPNDILFGDPAAIETKTRNILNSCKGRRFGIGTGGLTPVVKDGAEKDYLLRIRTFTDIFKRVRESVSD
jgi:hypothetical protein